MNQAAILQDIKTMHEMLGEKIMQLEKGIISKPKIKKAKSKAALSLRAKILQKANQ